MIVAAYRTAAERRAKARPIQLPVIPPGTILLIDSEYDCLAAFCRLSVPGGNRTHAFGSGGQRSIR
jgi:hypothetical protein